MEPQYSLASNNAFESNMVPTATFPNQWFTEAGPSNERAARPQQLPRAFETRTTDTDGIDRRNSFDFVLDTARALEAEAEALATYAGSSGPLPQRPDAAVTAQRPVQQPVKHTEGDGDPASARMRGRVPRSRPIGSSRPQETVPVTRTPSRPSEKPFPAGRTSPGPFRRCARAGAVARTV